MISIDKDQIELIKKLKRSDLEGYNDTWLICIALDEWLKEQAEKEKKNQIILMKK